MLPLGRGRARGRDRRRTGPTCSPSTGSRARSPRSRRRAAEPPVGSEPARCRRRGGRGRRRGLRGLPALHRPALPRRHASRPSPPWLRARLRRCRHAPDLERRRRDQLRHARARQPAARASTPTRCRAAGSSSGARGQGEEIRTLDGVVRKLDPADLLITDGERPVALAGIMGGEETEVTRGDDERPARGRQLRAGRRSCAAPSGCGCAPRARTGGRRASTRTSPSRPRVLRDRADRRSRRRPLGRARPRRSAPLAEPPVVRLRPERADARERARGRARRAARRSSSGSGSSVADDWTVTRPDLAGAGRDARDRRRRGGRALPARPTCRSRCPRRARCSVGSRREQRLRRRVEDVARRLRLLGGATPGRLQPSRPRPRTRSAARADLGRAGRPAHDAARRAGRRRPATTSTSAPSGSRCSRSRASTSRAASSCRRSAGASAGSRAAASSPRRASSRRCYGALKLEPAVRARRASPFLHPGKAARVPRRAGSASCIRPCSRGRGAPSSSTSRRCSPRAAERIEYEDVITYPAVRQDLAFVVDEDVPAGDLVDGGAEAAGPSCARRASFDVYRGEPGAGGAQVGRVRALVPVARPHALGRGRRRDARADRRRARERFGAELERDVAATRSASASSTLI